MVAVQLFLIYFYCLLIYGHTGYIQSRLPDNRVWKITGLGQCRGTNLPYKLYFQGAQIGQTRAYINNLTVTSAEVSKEKMRLAVTIRRCRSREDLNSCEEYHKIRNMDICLAVDPDRLISKENPLVLPFQPKLKCPVQKGVYSAHNITVDMTPFMFFNPEGWYWSTTGELYPPKENRLVSCTFVEGYIVPNIRIKT